MDASVEHALRQQWEAGRSAWPEVAVDADDFLAHAAHHLEPDDAEAADRLHGADLYLALACGRGDRAALEVFERAMLTAIAPVVRRIEPASHFLDEVRQRVRERLMVADGGRPKILDYAGRGPLKAWVRVTAVRIGLSMRPSRRHVELEDDDIIANAPLAADPDAEYLKARYAGEFQAALHKACRTLTARQRAVLRLKLLDGMNIDEIGVMYSVHRATIARWVSSAWQQIFEATRAELAATLQLTSEEFDSLLAVLRSRLDVSVTQLLRSTTG